MNTNQRSIHDPSPLDDDDSGTLPTKDLPTGDPTNQPLPGGDIQPGQPDVAGGVDESGDETMDAKMPAERSWR